MSALFSTGSLPVYIQKLQKGAFFTKEKTLRVTVFQSFKVSEFLFFLFFLFLVSFRTLHLKDESSKVLQSCFVFFGTIVTKEYTDFFKDCKFPFRDFFEI